MITRSTHIPEITDIQELRPIWSTNDVTDVEKLNVTNLPSESTTILTDLVWHKQNAKYYQVMIMNDKGEKLAFKQDDKWTIIASIEEVLDQILKTFTQVHKL